MIKTEYKVLGVMSGTSLDGIDLALIKLTKNDDWEYQILTADTIAYPENWKSKLGLALKLGEAELDQLNREYTIYLAGVISAFTAAHNIEDLDAVCSHGHTIRHKPENRYTLQIGNLPRLAELTGHRVVCDFRVDDVQLGGQGAPLVPIGDQLLFSEYDYCLNLGGFANVSTEQNGKRVAYDICPVNTVLNFYAEKLGYSYDEGGKLAEAGKLNEELFEKLNQLPFYRQPAPKSLGMEWVISEIFPLLKEFEKDVHSLLHTFCRHIAVQIAANLEGQDSSRVLVTGGGCYNDFLIRLIKEDISAHLEIPERKLIEFKEALIFGLLGVLKLREEINVLSSVTGAVKDHSSGKIYQA